MLSKMSSKISFALFCVTIVADDPIAEQAVLQHLSGPDVVDDEMAFAIAGGLFGHDSDMRDAASQVPAYNIPRMVVFGFVADGQNGALSFEKGHQIRHPPMIDVRVSMAHAPVFGILVEMGFHIQMHLLLQIDTELPIGTDHHIGTHALVRGHIAIRIGNLELGRVVLDLLMGQRQGRVRQTSVEFCLRSGKVQRTQKQQYSKQ